MMDTTENPLAAARKFPWQGLPPQQTALHGLPRMPPCNDRAEMALLGTLLANNLAAQRMGGFLKPEHFADPVHGVVFGAVMRRIDAGQMADLVTLTAEFEHSGKLDEVGGPAYLRTLLTACSRPIDPREYAGSIADAWLRRQVIDLGEQVSLAAERAVANAFGERDAEVDAAESAKRLSEELGRLLAQLDRVVLSTTAVPQPPRFT